MKFYSRYCRPEVAGDSDFPHVIPQFEMVVEVTPDKQIEKKLVQLPEEKSINIYDQIQSENHGLDVYDLIKRFNAGDPNVSLGVIDWEDGDYSAVTSSLLEMEARLNNCKGFFESADLELRKHYDNDFSKFLNGVDTGEFFEYQRSLEQPVVNKEDNTNE